MTEINNTALPAGTFLDSGKTRYRIVEVLGQGGFGITYLAIGEIKVENVTIEGKFAIKEHFPTAYCTRAALGLVEVRPDTAADFEASKADFISEARKLHKLGAQNDNIVKVNEVFETNGTAYYVMQYINGESLLNYIRKNGPMPYNEAIELLSPIIDAVGFLHKERINHLDIKPDNIMLHESVDGVTPILVDFGLCMHFTKSGNRTSAKGVQGVSEGYSPLEQYVGVNEFQPATDIYSLAATLLYTLTGETPKNAAEITPADIRTMLANVAPPMAIEAICKAMNKSMQERTPSIAVFKADLGIGTAKTGTATVPLKNLNVTPPPGVQTTDNKEMNVVAVPSTPRGNTRPSGPITVRHGDGKSKKWLLWGGVALLVVAAAIVLPLTLGGGGSKSSSGSSARSSSKSYDKDATADEATVEVVEVPDNNPGYTDEEWTEVVSTFVEEFDNSAPLLESQLSQQGIDVTASAWFNDDDNTFVMDMKWHNQTLWNTLDDNALANAKKAMVDNYKYTYRTDTSFNRLLNMMQYFGSRFYVIYSCDVNGTRKEKGFFIYPYEIIN